MSRTITILTILVASAACSRTPVSAVARPSRPAPTATSASTATEPSPVPTARGGGPLSIDEALGQIIETRCQQLERCDSTVSLFDSQDHCVAEYESRFAEQARLSCAAGIDSAALAGCLDQLSLSTCDAAEGDAWPRLCRPYLLCFLP